MATWINADFGEDQLDNYMKAISQEIPRPSIARINLKITILKFIRNLQAANELHKCAYQQHYITT